MRPLKSRRSPEKKGQNALRKYMVQRGWLKPQKTHGNEYQVGWPDLFTCHPEHGPRWIEMKSDRGKLRKSQVLKCLLWSRYGVQVWVLRGPKDYQLLFDEPNWRQFVPKRLKFLLEKTTDEIMKEIADVLKKDH